MYLPTKASGLVGVVLMVNSIMSVSLMKRLNVFVKNYEKLVESLMSVFVLMRKTSIASGLCLSFYQK